MRPQEGLLNVNPVLEQKKRRLAAVLGKCRGGQFNGCRRGVGNVLGAENDIVVWWNAFFDKIGNRVADLVVLACLYSLCT